MVELLTLVLIALDQLSKHYVKIYLPQGVEVKIIPGFFHLEQTRNKGAAWGFLHGKDWGIYVLTGISLIAGFLLYLLIKKTRPGYLRISLILILGGALGNLIDRLFLGEVVDFLAFHFGSYTFPYFNVADSLITVGAFLFFIQALFKKNALNDISFLNDEAKHDVV